MRWAGAECAEVVHGLDQAPPEEVGPDPVHDHPMQEGVGGRGDRPGPFQTSAALRDRHGFGPRDGLQETALDRWPDIPGFAADEHVGGFRRPIGHGQGTDRSRESSGAGADRFDEVGEGGSGGSPVEEPAAPEG